MKITSKTTIRVAIIVTLTVVLGLVKSGTTQNSVITSRQDTIELTEVKKLPLRVTANSVGLPNAAGIGGSLDNEGGNIVINGGVITARGGDAASVNISIQMVMFQLDFNHRNKEKSLSEKSKYFLYLCKV